jgi:hypothetical protein
MLGEATLNPQHLRHRISNLFRTWASRIVSTGFADPLAARAEVATRTIHGQAEKSP